MNNTKFKILICEDWQTRITLSQALCNENYIVQQFDSLDKVIEYINPGDGQVFLLGLGCKTRDETMSGLHVIPFIRKIDPNLAIIAIAESDSLDMEKKARMAGIFYYLIKPLNNDEVRLSVANAIQKYERFLGHEKMDMDPDSTD